MEESVSAAPRCSSCCCCCCCCGTWLLARCVMLLLLLQLASCGEANQEDDYTLAYVNVSYSDPLTKKPRSIKEEVGKFSQGKVGEASGLLVHWKHRNGSLNYGCEKTPFDVPGEPWIALVRRGGCSYARKISSAAHYNASAVVVYDDREGTTVKMPNSGAGYKMVAIFIPQENGERMAEMVDNGTRVYMYITVGTHQAVRYTNISRTSVLFVSISFIVLMIISLAWLIFYYVQRFRYINAKDQLARRLCSAAKKALSKIPLKTIKDTDAESECCAVCIEPYKVSDVVRILPCKHQFHKSCIDPWLLDQRTCPMCKMDILKFYGLVFAGSEESILQIDTDEGAHRVNLEPAESDVVPSRNSQQTSQVVCSSASGPVPSTNNVTSIQRSQNGQDGLAAKAAQPAGLAASSESEPGHMFQSNTIDCIKITMLENSPMTARMLNRSKMPRGHSDVRCVPGSDADHGNPGSSSRVELSEISAQEYSKEKEEYCNKSATVSLESTEVNIEEADDHSEDGEEVKVSSDSHSSNNNDNDDNSKPNDDNTGNGGAST